MVSITATEKQSRTLVFFEDLLIKERFIDLPSEFGDVNQTVGLSQTAYLTLEFLEMIQSLRKREKEA